MIGVIPARIHGMMDYAMGILLIALPWLMGFGPGARFWLPVLLGIGSIGSSLLTDYELGAARMIGMPNHLTMDAAGGLLLAASPWLFGFAGIVWAPHLILGPIERGAAAMTRTRPALAHGRTPWPRA